MDFLETLKCPAYKIASPEITDVNLIEYVAKKKKPIILSTGLSTDEDLKLSLKKIKRFHNKFALLKCSTSYPASLDELNLNAIGYLKKRYKCPVGFSDHTNSELAAKVAVVLGATIVEKHFKLDDDKKKKLIHLICRIKGEKVYDDYTEVGSVQVDVDDVELIVEKMMSKKLKLEIKSGV